MPVNAPPFTQHVIKPVNEEPEDEDVARDSTREHESVEDSRNQGREQESEEDVSEELSRTVPNPPRTPGASIPVIPGSIVYRPPQVTPLSIRGTPVTPPSPPSPPPPPPPAIQYRPTQKPTKAPRKQIVDDVAFKQPIKQPLKPVKPSQAYEIRGKKPVAQVNPITVDRALGKVESISILIIIPNYKVDFFRHTNFALN